MQWQVRTGLTVRWCTYGASIRSAAAGQGHSLAYTHLDILSAASVRARSNLATVCTVACTLLPCCRLRSWAARTSCRSCSWSRGVADWVRGWLGGGARLAPPKERVG